MRLIPVVLAFSFLPSLLTQAQFIDRFEDQKNVLEGTPEGWSVASGDGQVDIRFQQNNGYASIYVDATRDKRNIWWAIIRRQVPGLDMNKLMQDDKELRVEARIKVSHAPRRVNLHFNHQRTTDFHSHLMEFDIPDTINWHTISMTTDDFDVREGDRINVQMALMDWGKGKYRVDVDYIKVDVVDENMIDKDLGNKLPYHPPIPEVSSFRNHAKVDQDAIIDNQYADMNFNEWLTVDDLKKIYLLTVSGTQTVILRWDLAAYKGRKVDGAGLLELTTWSMQRSPEYEKDFGMVRVTEILAGDTEWEEETVTYNSFLGGLIEEKVLNTQMIIDYPVAVEQGQKSYFTISQFVLQRMIDGNTKGLAIKPLGAVVASFYSTESGDLLRIPVLHFNLK